MWLSNNQPFHCLQQINISLIDETKGEQQDVLHGLKFRLDGFTEEQTTQLQDDIEIYGGNVLSNISKTIADFLVVPLNYECKNNRAKTVVSRDEVL